VAVVLPWLWLWCDFPVSCRGRGIRSSEVCLSLYNQCPCRIIKVICGRESGDATNRPTPCGAFETTPRLRNLSTQPPPTKIFSHRNFARHSQSRRTILPWLNHMPRPQEKQGFNRHRISLNIVALPSIPGMPNTRHP